MKGGEDLSRISVNWNLLRSVYSYQDNVFITVTSRISILLVDVSPLIRRIPLWSIPIPVVIVLTIVTGLFVLASNLAFYYGYPLGWRLNTCPIAPIFGCPLFAWAPFILDVLFYTVIGGGLIIILTLVNRSLVKPTA